MISWCRAPSARRPGGCPRHARRRWRPPPPCWAAPQAGGLADHAAGGHDVLGVDAQVEPEVVLAGLHRHDDLLERAFCPRARPGH
ncbi:hypothetical protein DdX_22086 [Ditylenchus destructor]|uniref:Uncharacterized protein n=1 Tax=Ditylenchus destructor TaxID=166010 RepID=A0AAD4QSP9_9BILA|nr:hypothetical protein DdX_22086 [Ditylenchus destructor]